MCGLEIDFASGTDLSELDAVSVAVAAVVVVVEEEDSVEWELEDMGMECVGVEPETEDKLDSLALLSSSISNTSPSSSGLAAVPLASAPPPGL